ncbi:phosphatidylserine synthase [Haloferax mediterranei ATCC 33500]|uniref:CDP-diacylglycerol--serine O-phosphatidyltransferase n=1 Tax=Haloferax mediterranei (strain ATCC 33500 / DSM 1411 / JCM 8866 / NBRC 14739 / NCIMB 2177 / R-4) TaxID=523841 RepID=I3R696_HALMT|nr:CDP-alcohol phosphatidyltransferase family protein [Haloferax mediterranei]AFK19756.1 CDP-diacylglycerol--serine O-phosphatidyltransferase (phosphatidylserine synthase) [Haloferax mediterranei ATCC 33500]AHZ23142.1 phosphatidylserine synthase [Haloferax mediterranei ATCC 33500]EMA00078.1 CDP-diacylglycerol--serine O-phosphatidyltransferase [Haloferax mediterranei ATCC 33500]MDX5987499.1 CDP-alcohol phosphatidyltransferase family protein [Haloferax mediterranei ATCC 33500]QCQ73999.1 phosphat
MTDELRSTLRGGVNAIDARASEIVRSSTGENMISRLGTADWLSLGALFWAWVGAILFVSNEPNWAIMAVLVGFVFDKADGYYARKTGTTSAFGRQIDSFIDIFTYLVSAALLYHIALAPNAVVSAVVGFVVLSFGGLRLIRHNSEGFGDESGTSYYHGTTVVHTHLVVLANYFLFQFVPMWNGWVAGATIVAVCPLMTSDYKAYKTDAGHVLVGIAGSIAVAGCLALEFGVL